MFNRIESPTDPHRKYLLNKKLTNNTIVFSDCTRGFLLSENKIKRGLIKTNQESRCMSRKTSAQPNINL